MSEEIKTDSIPPDNKTQVRPMSYGEMAVGLDFNPGGHPDVQKIKELYAQIIDLCNNHITPDPSEKNRLFKVAITEAQGAQMFAVKAITYKY